VLEVLHRKTVNLAEIRQFKVLVPPLPLQKEFAKRMTESRVESRTSEESRKARFAISVYAASGVYRGTMLILSSGRPNIPSGSS
jgi:hypothetical protein